jgi:transcriptional regulator with XRE-family HTH domain
MRLKEIRESKFVTQRELAAKSGVGLSTIVRLEQSKQIPRFSTVRKLAAALEVDPKELMEP